MQDGGHRQSSCHGGRRRPCCSSTVAVWASRRPATQSCLRHAAAARPMLMIAHPRLHGHALSLLIAECRKSCRVQTTPMRLCMGPIVMLGKCTGKCTTARVHL